ncbi:kelch-like protein diablo [Tetranychus urticae]|uniref:kelch-like protein diablo n=1 Tax=Tetranychus urticae TaxID=32264 RepID=UPI000D659260|nr:kelch-like protein diablo [Tetranychus urticae]
MDSLDTDDQLTIVNRSTEHRISKNLIRRIPYFEKMLSHECLESKENKVELDFDEKAFKWLLNWIEFGDILIEMDYMINLCNVADYFGIKDHLMQDCSRYFFANFSSEHLPVVIPQVTSTSKSLNSGAINSFICRHFFKIVNTTYWCEYPFETIEYICALDLMVHSEYQVFKAIQKWVKFKVSSRKYHLKGLLKFVRWCHLKDKDLSKIKENVLIKSHVVAPEICSTEKTNCKCSIDRTKQGCFVTIEELVNKNLRVKVLDDLLPLINQVIQSDESMPLHLLHGKHVSDISFDSGRKMIRIDCKQNNYRLFDHSASKSHCLKMIRCISEEQQSENRFVSTKTQLYFVDRNHTYEGSLLDANEKFILVRNELHQLGESIFFRY